MLFRSQEEAHLWIAYQRPTEAIQAFDKALAELRQHEKMVRWNQFERIYDEYEQALIEWGLDRELAQMSRKRFEDKRRFH